MIDHHPDLGLCRSKAKKLRPNMRGLTEIMPEESPAENDKVYHTAVDDLRNTAADYIKMKIERPPARREPVSKTSPTR